MRSLVPVVVVTTAAGSLVGWRTPARAIVVVFETAFAFLIGFIWRDGGWHGGSLL
jgi:hypothetical protein